ncbi:GNAT family N-acetyltransferase [Streptomyces odontomachi]|uniref:GNAT family N-acetyltransferase n=1 Tax=Streptomyces odontomachi TaxID=2944940 RepID=UPI0035A9216D
MSAGEGASSGACDSKAPKRPRWGPLFERSRDALVGEVERWARRNRARTMRLAVVPGNGPAFALYERCGFQDTGELGDVLPDGVRRELVMAKELPVV